MTLERTAQRNTAPAHPRQLRCPRCTQPPLEETHYADAEIDICPRCGGLWCERHDWDHDELGPQPTSGTYQSEPGTERAPDMVVEGQSTLHCPKCQRPLTVLKAGYPPICEIDLCDGCGGVWFDHREWDHLEALYDWPAEAERLNAPPTWGNWWLQFLVGLPTEFNIRPRRFPTVTVGLIAVCTIVFLIQLASPTGLVFLATRPDQVMAGREWWTLFTSMFLHAGWLHLIGNMYLLYILGDNVEDVLGPWRYLAFYLGCGIVADLVFVLSGPHVTLPSVGASGAIAGVMAAYLLLFWRARLTFMFIIKQWKVPVWLWIGFWFALNLLMLALEWGQVDDMAGVAWGAHVGGFLAGLAFVWPQERKLVQGHSLLLVMRRVGIADVELESGVR